MTPSDILARHAPLPGSVHAYLFGRWPELLRRADLSREAWDAALPTATVEQAAVLVARPLDAVQLDAVVRAEKRQSTLAVLCREHWDDLDDVQRLTVAKRARGALAANLVGRAHGELRDVLVGRLDGNDRLRWLADTPPSDLDDDTLRSHLATVADWLPDTGPRGARTRNQAVQALAHYRTTVLDELVDRVPGFAYPAVAGALTIFEPAVQDRVCDRVLAEALEYAAMALAANPVLTPENEERLAAWARDNGHAAVTKLLVPHATRTGGDPLAVTDATVFHRLVRRTVPSEYRPGGRLAQMVHLCASPLVEAHLSAVVPHMAQTRQCGDWAADRALEDLAARYAGTDGLGLQVRGILGQVAEHGADPGYLPGTGRGAGARPTAPAGDHDTDTAWWEAQRASSLPAYERLGDLAARLAPMGPLVGDDRQAWELLLTMADTFPGTLPELVAVARATAA